MRTQHVHHLDREPAGVAELDRVAKVGREFRERAGKALIVALEGRRQLPQQRTELARLRERLDPIEQELDVPAALAQPLDVRQYRLTLTANVKSGGVSSAQRLTASRRGSR